MIIAGDDGTKFEMVSLGFEAFLPITGLDHRFWLRAKYRCEKKITWWRGSAPAWSATR